jgi:hypothetical protein
VVNDTTYEGAEAFRLVVEGEASGNNAPTQGRNFIRVMGMGVIGDDGRGPIYNESGNENDSAIKDDDRGLRISNILINEASTYGIFTLTNRSNAANRIKLSLADSNQRDFKKSEGTFDINQPLEVWLDNRWQNYSGSVTIQAGATAYVRVNVRTEQDNTYEGQLKGPTSVGESFKLEVISLNDNNKQFGVASIFDDGTGVIYTGVINQDGAQIVTTGLDDDLDKDGLPPNIEEILATLSASSGKGGSPGDLNNDGIPDSEQSAVGTLAWMTAKHFLSGLAGQLSDTRPIISISAVQGSMSNKANANYQLEKIRVLNDTDIDLDGQPKPNNDRIIDTPWDALRFGISVDNKDADAQLDDIDPSRPGTQIRLLIDISRADMNTGDFNAYYKYISATALDVYNKQNIQLRGLNGQPIKQPGWYDFTQVTANGDGARFISRNGKITAIELVITDNAFGDNNPKVNAVDDPGLPVKVASPAQVPSSAQVPSPTQTSDPDDVSPPNRTPATKTASIGLQNKTQNATAAISSVVLPAGTMAISGSTAASIAAKSPGFQPEGAVNKGGPSNSELRQAEDARQALIDWAHDTGLGHLVLSAGAQSAHNTAAQPQQAGPFKDLVPSAFQRDLSALGPDLLSALSLGAAGLYMTQTVGQRSLEQLARDWLRKLRPMPAGWIAASAGKHERVISVFVVQGGGQRPKLVAAQILADAIEILAEQPLQMRAPAGTPWDLLDLDHALDQLCQALHQQERDDQPLLLLDPALRSHRNALKTLGRHQALLRHLDLDAALRALQPDEQELLRRWLNQPSQTAVTEAPGCQAVMQQLAQLQGHWRKTMPQAMANVTGVLELSIALGNLEPTFAVV